MSQRHQKSLHQNPTRPHPRVKTNFDFFYRLPNMAVRISPGRVAPALRESSSPRDTMYMPAVAAIP